MPGFDRTGPEGNGARTGRMLGACGDRSQIGCGRGLGRGLKRGRGAGGGMGFKRGSRFERSEGGAIESRLSALDDHLRKIAEKLN